MDVYLLDEALNPLYIVDDYTSLIWADRYNELGDCELAIKASFENIERLKETKYISCDTSDMICKIAKIEIITDEENGDQLIVTGIDVKNIVHQRIVANQINFYGTVEDYIRRMITDNIINPSNVKRKISNFVLGAKADFPQVIEQQITWDNLGEKIEELCKTYAWGYKVDVQNGNFVFKLYAGTDRSDYVIFSSEYENLGTTDYINDKTDIKTTAMIAGEGEGVGRVVAEVGQDVTGVDRLEVYVDGSDVSKTIDYGELVRSYPDGEEVEIGGVTYYQVNGVNIAILTITSTSITAKLTDTIYKKSLLSKGEEALAEFVEVVSFEGSIVPSTSFVYKEDYWLGDVVTIENEYGLSADARITEVVEVYDENGYSIEIKFDYLSFEVDEENYILSETGERLTTENGNYLILESAPMMVNNTLASSGLAVSGSVKISELPESTDIYDGCCLPIVTYGETKKLTYALLKERLQNDLDFDHFPEGGEVGDMLVKGVSDNAWEHKNALTNTEIEELINAMV